MRKPRGGCGDRGGATGKDSKIEADCIKAEDGSVTCDTKVVSQVTEPSSALMQSASILLSLPVSLPGLRSHLSV